MNDRRREKNGPTPSLRLHATDDSSQHGVSRDKLSLPNINPNDVSFSLGLGPIELTSKDLDNSQSESETPPMQLSGDLSQCDQPTGGQLRKATAIPACGRKTQSQIDMSTIAKSMFATPESMTQSSETTPKKSAAQTSNRPTRNIHGPTGVAAPHIRLERQTSSELNLSADGDTEPHFPLKSSTTTNTETDDLSTPLASERQNTNMTDTTKARTPFSPRIRRPSSVIDSTADSDSSAFDDSMLPPYAEPTGSTFEDSTIDEHPEYPGNRGQLVCNNLSKTYRKGGIAIPVLKDVNLCAQSGELLAIIGQSGSGKSTLLHLLATLDAPDEGAVFFDGLRIDNITPKRRDEIRNRNFGMIFQFYHLLPELTTLENVLAPQMIQHGFWAYRRRRRKLRERAAAMLDTVGLSHRLNHKPRELSGGEMQRTAIARALINEPDILLADEPTGNLDKSSGEEIIELLRTLNQERNLTIVMVTHDLGIADQADRTVRLVDGKIVDQTPIEKTHIA